MLMIVLLLAVAPRARGEDPVSEGNRAFAAGEYDQALKAYDRASAAAPAAPQPDFNRGTVYYIRGDYQKAREMFEEAALKSRDLALKARSQYNLGNCAFREGELYAADKPEQAVAALQRAVDHYQRALELDATLADAAHNTEVSRLTLKQLLERLEQQQAEAAAGRQPQQQNREELQEKGEERGEESPGQQEGGAQGQGNDDQSAAAAPPPQSAAGEPFRAAEAGNETARDILAREQQEREQRQQGQNFDARPVERDW